MSAKEPLVEMSINQRALEKFFSEKADRERKDTFFTWDINEMAKQTCMSKSFIENEFLHDPRMRLLERRKEKGKRYWFYEESKQVMKEIMEEW